MTGFRVALVAGARPNFMKIAPLVRALTSQADVDDILLIHTGQHYDAAMSEAFFRQLRIPSPDVHLEVGSGTHAAQTAEVMKRFEPVLVSERPHVVVVVGDVNSTLACALVAAKLNVRVVHVEAGLRSGDRSMPEEINRILTDQIATRLYVTERSAVANLRREGIAEDQIVFAGNVMVDSLLSSLELAVPAAQTLAGWSRFEQGAASGTGFGVLTLHRPSNVDDPIVLRRLLSCISEIGKNVPLAFPVHPRTLSRVQELAADLPDLQNSVLLLPPLGYHEMLGLLASAKLVLTDSGGIQEETTVLGVPCVTLRENTERPITIDQGTNVLAGSDPARILAAVDRAMEGHSEARVPELWDGRAAERIATDLVRWLRSGSS